MFETMNGKTPDLTKDNIEKLKQLFPEIVTDGKIDFEKLQVLLGEEIDNTPDRYNFTWNGKKETIQFAQQPSKGTLRPVKEKSKNWDSTRNLYIEGDNLEVLKLLQKSYNNKVKMIFIDPPYNTGNDFIYKDDFKDNVDSYLKLTGQKDSEGNKFTSNNESYGRYHTNWLNMMYPRIKLARNLLQENGVIFITLDDGENYNMRKICNEIFGENNFITEFTWEKKKKPSFLHRNVGKLFDYILCYSKNANSTEAFSVEQTTEGKKYPFNNAGNGRKIIVLPKGAVTFSFESGEIEPQDMSEGNIITELLNTVIVKDYKNESEVILDGEWRYSQDKINEIVEAGDEISISKIPFRPNHIKAGGEIKKMKNMLSPVHYNCETNEDGTEQIIKIFGKQIFDTPKPIKLIKMLINGVTYNDKDSIILDFFSGSATTAYATMELNAEDDGNRKFIMVQLPEILEEKSEAYKDGYRTICDIGEERIRRVGEKVKSDLIEKNNKEGLLSENQVKPDDLDIGFKVFKLDSSNLTEWQADFDELESNIDLFESNFLKDRSELDILFEIMLKNGLDLTYPVTEISEGNHKIYDVAAGNLFVCLNDNINRDVAQKIAELRKEYGIETSQVVFKDSGFEDDMEKLNCYEILKEAGYQDSDLLSI